MQATYEQWSQGRGHIQWGTILPVWPSALPCKCSLPCWDWPSGHGDRFRRGPIHRRYPISDRSLDGHVHVDFRIRRRLCRSRFSGASSRTEGLYQVPYSGV